MVGVYAVTLLVCVEPDIKVENPPYVEPTQVEVWLSDPPLPEVDFCGYNLRGQKVCCP